MHPRIVDGSGLSRADRTTPRQVVRLLERMHGQEVGPDFEASLPIAGRTGTLQRRMRGTAAAGRCRAKTGTLIGVSALAGDCATTSGHTLAFALLMNRANVGRAHGVQDRMTAAIAGLLTAEAGPAGRPRRAPATPSARPSRASSPAFSPATT